MLGETLEQRRRLLEKHILPRLTEPICPILGMVGPLPLKSRFAGPTPGLRQCHTHTHPSPAHGPRHSPKARKPGRRTAKLWLSGQTRTV
jgi:hypothetical protein